MSNGTFNIPGYNSFSGCDMIVTARMTQVVGHEVHEKSYSLGSLQTLSISTHQDKRPVRALGNMNAIDYTMGQRTIAGSMVFAVFDRHFATEMFNDLKAVKGDALIMPDELPPLDITITFANEYGRTSRMAVYGIRLVNEGQVMSINDVYTENTYQFVANALEPLNKGETNGAKTDSKQRTVIEPSTDYIKTPDITGEDIVDHIYNNNISISGSDIKLTVEVEQPKNGYILGIAKFQLSPKQVNGHINIINLTNGKTTKIYLENIINQNIIYQELEYGKYTAVYYGEEDYLYSNTVSFSIEGQRNINIEKNDQPILEKINHNSIVITCNNNSHTHVECVPQTKTRNNEVIQVELVSKKATILDLSPDAYYLIRTTDLKGNYSKSTIALTLAYEKQDVELFIDYILSNQKLLKDDIAKYLTIIDKIAKSNSSNIIDAVISAENSIRSKEILLFAIKYQNELNLLFNNSDLPMPNKIISEPFWDTFKHDDQSVKANYFYTKKRKNYFDLSIAYPSIHTHTGATNRRYHTYDMLEDGSRGIRCDFSYIDDESRSQLEIYKNVDLVSQLDVSKVRMQYPKISTQTLYEVAAKESNQPHIRVLKAPYITYDDINDTIVADLDYTETLGNSDKTFYLCISEIKEALDHTPKRKIPFASIIKEFEIYKYASGVSKNKTYLAWIENESFDIISYSTIFKTNSDMIEIDAINTQDSHKEYNSIKKALETKVGKRQVLDTVFSYVMSYQNISKKLYDSLEQELINYSYNDVNSDIYLYELLKVKFDRENYVKNLCKKVVYNKDARTVKFITEKSCHISRTEYTLNDSIIKSTLVPNSNVVLSDNRNYTLLYLVETSLIATSGFVLINNVTGDCYSYNLETEVI